LKYRFQSQEKFIEKRSDLKVLDFSASSFSLRLRTKCFEHLGLKKFLVILMLVILRLLRYFFAEKVEEVFCVIPARLNSTRLEKKLLLPLKGKPLILHTLERALKVFDKVIVATDSVEILQVVEKSRATIAVMTSPLHNSGSDRVAEVAENLPENSIIINLQADEPLIEPSVLQKAAGEMLKNSEIKILTTCEKIEEPADVLNPNVVKVVLDRKGFALYFSRSPIPFPREAVRKYGSLEKALFEEKQLISLFRKHTGLYAYRRETLLEFSRLNQSKLEQIENLEQLRALENSIPIKVIETREKSIGVDTLEDFQKVQEILRG
jgi:3-deoxy-manno-octulosonate cytidylyltransferase (CMP-KDO synthetase)